MSPNVRMLPYAVADGACNMAADEVLLESALAGVASLRFYGWSVATVSLGYFQPARLRLEDSRLAPLPFVRRPSGGKTLVHHHELTYALALPAGLPWQTKAQPWLCRMHDIIAAALGRFGVTVAAAACAVPAPLAKGGTAGALCFLDVTAGDLLYASAKVVGSAQRKQRGALLQHGAVLLSSSPHAAGLPGLAELAKRSIAADALREAIQSEWDKRTGWPLVQTDWSDAEQRRIDELAHIKYRQASWNERR